MLKFFLPRPMTRRQRNDLFSSLGKEWIGNPGLSE
jgi:hypothetical protein